MKIGENEDAAGIVSTFFSPNNCQQANHNASVLLRIFKDLIII